jgi:hypothetical protein
LAKGIGKRSLLDPHYECYLGGWILPCLGIHRREQIKPVAVKEWLGIAKREKATKAKIRNL